MRAGASFASTVDGGTVLIARCIVVVTSSSDVLSRWLEPMMRLYGGMRIAEPCGSCCVSSCDCVLSANR